MIQDLEFWKVTPSMEGPLGDLFEAIAGDQFFTPHPLTRAHARTIANHTGRDFYGVALWDSTFQAYGMLRGWDEGYEVPSLGISVAPLAQGLGIGRVMMHYLHAVARLRGAARVRLRVHERNTRALNLYESLGYVFEADTRPEHLLGFLELR